MVKVLTVGFNLSGHINWSQGGVSMNSLALWTPLKTVSIKGFPTLLFYS